MVKLGRKTGKGGKKKEGGEKRLHPTLSSLLIMEPYWKKLQAERGGKGKKKRGTQVHSKGL